MPDDEAIAAATSRVLPLVGVQNLKPLQMISLRLLVYGFEKLLIFHVLHNHLCPTSSQWLHAISCRSCGAYGKSIEVADERSGRSY